MDKNYRFSEENSGNIKNILDTSRTYDAKFCTRTMSRKTSSLIIIMHLTNILSFVNIIQ